MALDTEHSLLVALFRNRGHEGCQSGHRPFATFERQHILHREEIGKFAFEQGMIHLLPFTLREHIRDRRRCDLQILWD